MDLISTLINKKERKLKKTTLTVLAVPSHVLPWAFTRIVSNLISANSPILTRIPFTFIDI